MSININGIAVHPNCTAKNSNFRGAAFNRVNMHHSDFRYSDFDGTILINSNISHSNLTKASFVGANISGSNFQGCNLEYADFSGAIWGDSDFRNTDLRTAKLNFGYFSTVMIDKTTQLPDFQIPQNVDLTGWKVFRNAKNPSKLVIGEIRIPKSAKRTACLGSNKCRASAIILVNLSNGDSVANSWYQTNFVYNIGEVTNAGSYDPDIRKECSFGIHFFTTPEQAEHYGNQLL